MDAELARSLWNYDEITGELRWKVIPHPKARICVGAVAGSPNADGYLMVQYRDKNYRVHRLAWLMSTGAWPVHEIDHINGARDDNRLVNLREATRSQNNRNYKCHRAGQARFTTYHKRDRKWVAQSPRIDGKRKFLGYHATMELASEAAEKWLELNYQKGLN
jgi:hypothetical protein